ncbi:hypothetical protein NEHOM01_1633 [Nematocida homosporus]|uniref:uncharacterized protein n=1 Tax=Nematocida homosporus TaxID=1912981 RepID=UPI00221FD979|nr:uncharacterized protein NEHOM01_1633 [Nematocida homosporus]KAI5186680.1 hypothetical protein NEHOM01_1633 [Nematocida homosporus]
MRDRVIKGILRVMALLVILGSAWLMSLTSALNFRFLNVDSGLVAATLDHDLEIQDREASNDELPNLYPAEVDALHAFLISPTIVHYSESQSDPQFGEDRSWYVIQYNERGISIKIYRQCLYIDFAAPFCFNVASYIYTLLHQVRVIQGQRFVLKNIDLDHFVAFNALARFIVLLNCEGLVIYAKKSSWPSDSFLMHCREDVIFNLVKHDTKRVYRPYIEKVTVSNMDENAFRCLIEIFREKIIGWLYLDNCPIQHIDYLDKIYFTELYRLTLILAPETTDVVLHKLAYLPYNCQHLTILFSRLNKQEKPPHITGLFELLNRKPTIVDIDYGILRDYSDSLVARKIVKVWQLCVHWSFIRAEPLAPARQTQWIQAENVIVFAAKTTSCYSDGQLLHNALAEMSFLDLAVEPVISRFFPGTTCLLHRQETLQLFREICTNVEYSDSFTSSPKHSSLLHLPGLRLKIDTDQHSRILDRLNEFSQKHSVFCQSLTYQQLDVFSGQKQVTSISFIAQLLSWFGALLFKGVHFENIDFGQTPDLALSQPYESKRLDSVPSESWAFMRSLSFSGVMAEAIALIVALFKFGQHIVILIENCQLSTLAFLEVYQTEAHQALVCVKINSTTTNADSFFLNPTVSAIIANYKPCLSLSPKSQASIYSITCTPESV